MRRKGRPQNLMAAKQLHEMMKADKQRQDCPNLGQTTLTKKVSGDVSLIHVSFSVPLHFDILVNSKTFDPDKAAQQGKLF